MNKKIVVGTSYARSYKEIKKWSNFFETIGIELLLPNITIENAVKIANDNFKYASEYCYTRKATLGEYVKLAQDGCDILLVISRVDNINNPCNTTRYLAAQLNEFFNNTKRIIDCQISKNNERKQLNNLARLLGITDDLIIDNAIEAFINTESHK